MARIYRILVGVSWGLGLLSMMVGAVLKLVHGWAAAWNTSPRGGMIFAGTLFLCALATREMERSVSPTS